MSQELKNLIIKSIEVYLPIAQKHFPEIFSHYKSAEDFYVGFAQRNMIFNLEEMTKMEAVKHFEMFRYKENVKDYIRYEMLEHEEKRMSKLINEMKAK